MNGVAGTMRRLAAAAAEGSYAGTVVVASHEEAAPGTVALPPDWSLPLPSYESLDLRFPLPTDVLDVHRGAAPDVIHVATPGPVGFCGLVVARLLGVPVVGSYHTELGPYALHLTRDLLVAEAMEVYVDWFYGRCATVLAPTRGVADALEARGLADVGVWGRGVDTDLFTPERRDEELRERLLDGGDLLILSVGRLSQEKRIGVLLDAFARVSRVRPGGAARRRRRRAGAAGAGADRSVRHRLRRRGARSRACCVLRERRRLLLPEHDRHVRPGAARSGCVRAARRRRCCRRRARARR